MLSDYTPEARNLFGPYSNGVSEVWGDPLALYRRLVHCLDGEPTKFLRGLRAPDEATRYEATERVIEAARLAFSLAPFDPTTGGGTLDRDALILVKRFIEWRDDFVKKKPPMPTSLPSTLDAGTFQTP